MDMADIGLVVTGVEDPFDELGVGQIRFEIEHRIDAARTGVDAIGEERSADIRGRHVGRNHRAIRRNGCCNHRARQRRGLDDVIIDTDLVGIDGQVGIPGWFKDEADAEVARSLWLEVGRAEQLRSGRAQGQLDLRETGRHRGGRIVLLRQRGGVEAIADRSADGQAR